MLRMKAKLPPLPLPRSDEIEQGMSWPLKNPDAQAVFFTRLGLGLPTTDSAGGVRLTAGETGGYQCPKALISRPKGDVLRALLLRWVRSVQSWLLNRSAMTRALAAHETYRCGRSPGRWARFGMNPLKHRHPSRKV